MIIVPGGIPKPIWASLAGGIGGFIMGQFQLNAAIPLMKEWLKKHKNKNGSSDKG